MKLPAMDRIGKPFAAYDHIRDQPAVELSTVSTATAIGVIFIAGADGSAYRKGGMWAESELPTIESARIAFNEVLD